MQYNLQELKWIIQGYCEAWELTPDRLIIGYTLNRTEYIAVFIGDELEVYRKAFDALTENYSESLKQYYYNFFLAIAKERHTLQELENKRVIFNDRYHIVSKDAVKVFP